MTETVEQAEIVAKKPKQEERRDRIDLRADPDWIDRAQAIADRFDISLTAYIKLAVNERMERDEQPRKRPGE